MPKTITKEFFDSITKEDIASAILRAREQLLAEDKTLLVHDAHERSICTRLAFYLAHEFPQFDVDVEYNRNHADWRYQKRIYHTDLIELISPQRRTGDEDGLMVLPDIIVHIRDTAFNLLVIEAKKSSSQIPEVKDIAKLQALKEELGYRYAYFIRFSVGKQLDAGGVSEAHFI